MMCSPRTASHFPVFLGDFYQLGRAGKEVKCVCVCVLAHTLELCPLFSGGVDNPWRALGPSGR